MTIKEIREAENKMTVSLSLPAADAEKIIKYYSQKQDKKGVSGCGALDADIIKAAADASGVVLPSDYKKRLQLARMAQGITAKKPKKTKSDKINAENVNNQKRADNSAVYSDTDQKEKEVRQGGGLPSGFIDLVQSLIDDYCQKFNIEDIQKAAAVQWRAACMYCGMYFKESKYFIDKEKSARQGGRIYNADMIADSVPVWAFLCGSYKKIPLVSDFIAFSGVSSSWFYDNNGHGVLTSAGADIVKKLSEIQAAGLSSGIVDGRENPTGKIYFTKAVLGWSDNGGGQIMEEKNKNNIDALPVFDSSGAIPGTKNT